MVEENFKISRGTVESPSGSISYFRAGDGHPLVLLHSLALSADMWIPIMSEFLNEFEVIAIDLRGHGRSSYDGKDFSVEDMAGDVRLVLDALSVNSVYMLGLSMGGCVAINFAATSPSSVERLVLCDTTAWYGPDAPNAWKARARTALTRPRLMQVPFQVDRWFGEKFRRTNPELVSHVVGIFLETRPEVHAKACTALGEFDNTGLLANITAQTLAMTGADDGATPPDMGQRLGAEIPNARFVLAPGLKHFAMIESPSVRRAALQHLLGLEVDEGAVSSEAACCSVSSSEAGTQSEEEKI
ncbi:MAG: alpha/beta fold hydrolase [Actinomycetota bacterium]|nr:MAG: alpha/beta fold hydrolase [Actinomycetota bacterium]